MQENKTRLNPVKILGLWILSMLILTPCFMYVSNIGASGGEQKPLTTLATMIAVTIYGAAFISALTPLFFKKWFKRNWWYIIIILVTFIPVIGLIKDMLTADPYSYSEKTKEINGDTFLIKTEYYDDNEFKKIRSISYWKNNKKDSTWTTYSENGNIISQETYRNDTLIKK